MIRAPRWRPRLHFVTTTLLLGVCVWVVVSHLDDVGFAEVMLRWRSAHYLGVVGAVAFVVLHLLLWAYRWMLAVRRIDTTPRRRVIFAALAASASVNLVAPFLRVLGGLVRARYLAKDGRHSLAVFGGVVLFDQLAHFVVMSAITLSALVAGAILAGRYAMAAGFALVATTGIVTFLAWAGPGRVHLVSGRLFRWFARSRLARWGPLRSLRTQGGQAWTVVQRLFADRPLRRSMALSGVTIFLATAAAQACVFVALGEDPRWLVVVVTVALGTAAGTLAGTPGGLGVTEAAMIALYVALGVDRVSAATAALLYRAIYYVVVLATGLPSLLALEWSLGRRPAGGSNSGATEGETGRPC